MPLEPRKEKAISNSSRTNSRISGKSFRFSKRLFDIIVSLFGIIFFSPIFIFVSVLLKRAAPGSVFYFADRLGMHGQVFKMIKFRTMREDTQNGKKITAHDDDRITPLGKWLRNTKINELPQLWNVLKGQMSLVGPRPEDPEIAENWPEDVKKVILSIRPGITSPASVVYRREEQLLSGEGFMEDYLDNILPDKLRLDYLYVKDHNLLMDLDILLLTLLGILPLLRKYPFPEKLLFFGPLSSIVVRYFSWFLIDLMVSFIAVFFSAVIWRLSGPLDLGWGKAFLVALVLSVIFSLVNSILGLGKVYWSKARAAYALDLLFSTVLSTILVYALNWVFPGGRLLSPSLVVIIGIMSYLFFVAARYRLRLLTGLASRWISYRERFKKLAFGEKTLVVGAGECGQLAAWLLIRSKFETPYNILGMVDDDPRIQGQTIDSYKVLGQTKDIPSLVEKMDIGLILFAITNLPKSERNRILSICRSTSAHLVIIPDLLDYFRNQLARQV
ncbi:MAG: sugar transferase, partial [Anaerolineales bacterium]